MKRIFIDPARCLGCKTCEIACSIIHSRSRRPGAPILADLYKVVLESPPPTPRVHVQLITNSYYPALTMPMQCRHCERPPCVSACITGALRKGSDGRVTLMEERCIGCWMCVMVCPYGAIEVKPEYKTAVKCDMCEGEPMPACAASCPTNAIIYSDAKEFISAKQRRISEALRELVYVKPGGRLIDLS